MVTSPALYSSTGRRRGSAAALRSTSSKEATCSSSAVSQSACPSHAEPRRLEKRLAAPDGKLQITATAEGACVRLESRAYGEEGCRPPPRPLSSRVESAGGLQVGVVTMAPTLTHSAIARRFSQLVGHGLRKGRCQKVNHVSRCLIFAVPLSTPVSRARRGRR